MAFVVDSSVALAWLLPDEQSDTADALKGRLETQRPVAPTLWPLEVGNALLSARRRGRLTERDIDRLLEVFAALPIEVEVAAPVESLLATIALARRYRLTTYDAAYLELAKRRGLPLATFDSRLGTAASAAGITRLP